MGPYCVSCIFCPLQGTYALDTWCSSNMMYLQAPTAGNSVFGPFMTSFVVILGHFEPGHAPYGPLLFSVDMSGITFI